MKGRQNKNDIKLNTKIQFDWSETTSASLATHTSLKTKVFDQYVLPSHTGYSKYG